ncbi:antitoxin [Streptomyces sp. A012304]|uniref:antitoxin n=1 Tax=Streptomyces sp. A012304 TaxID=375446 RepID=UPI002232B354|nr:antitoxin [Streptomyces sp. A012304]GKQ33684.1 hypothetical protein ALMP_02350 [Streptomyces sp. A012304]
MGIFDKLKGHGRDKAKRMSDTAEQKANERTGNKRESQVDSAQQHMQRRLGMEDEQRPPEQP